jgi:hypothetical protein
MPAIVPLIGLAASAASAAIAKGNKSSAPTVQAMGANQQQADQSYGNTQQGLQQQQQFIQALQGQNGIQNQSDVYNQFALQAQGQGPNPALAQLANATGQNVAQQSALMAGQRGAGANAGLIARQAAMQGAGIQQNAAGQAAVLQAQQQLAAQNQMANIAGQQVNNLGNAGNAYTNAALSQHQNVINSLNAQMSAQGQNAAVQQRASEANAKSDNAALGGTVNAVGAALPAVFGSASQTAAPEVASSSPVGSTPGLDVNTSMGAPKPYYAQGGAVAPSHIPQSALGKALKMRAGGAVPGQAKVAGDSLKNDTVDAKLSPGEIVIPRSIAQAPDAPKKAAEFVAAIHARKKGKK